MIDFTKIIHIVTHVSLVRQFQACVCVIAPSPLSPQLRRRREAAAAAAATSATANLMCGGKSNED